MITIIVPNYNSEKYLPRCIDSILAQTYTDFELLLINDGSTDSSGVICDEYATKDSRIRVFHKENGGVSSARNVGLDNAKGEWIGWVDSDDYIASNMYENLFNTIEITGADYVYCNFYMDYGTRKEIYYCPNSTNKNDLLIKWLREDWNVLWNTLVKRELYETNKLRFDTDFNFAEDFFMTTSLYLISKRIVNIDKGLYFYNRCNEHSICANNFNLSDLKKAYSTLFSSFKKKGIFDKYKKYLYWRVLDKYQHWLMDADLFENYINFLPESTNELWSCPMVSIKRKIMIWCITHKLSYIAKLMLKLYKLSSNNNV